MEKRDINLRRAIQLQEPTPVTLQDLVPLCVIQKPFPSFEGEKRVTDTSRLAKEGDVVRIKGREFLENTKLDTLDDETLARGPEAKRVPLPHHDSREDGGAKGNPPFNDVTRIRRLQDNLHPWVASIIASA